MKAPIFFLAFLVILLLLYHHQQHDVVLGDGSVVSSLPQFQGPLPFYLETGYIGVGEEENAMLFYYFVKASGAEPEKDPLLLWLTGGPGCSVLSAFLYENGPLNFDFSTETDNGLPHLRLNPHSWTQFANILFLDLPVGTGFSYGKTAESTYSTTTQSCHQAYAFLRKWLDDHGEFVSSPFYVAGDSYSGLMIPIITQIIADGNEDGIKPQINLKGYIVGNGLTFKGEDNYRVPFAHGLGIIPDELYASLRQNCDENATDDSSTNEVCLHYFKIFAELMNPLNKNNVYEPECQHLDSRIDNENRRSLREAHFDIKCRNDMYKFSSAWANDPAVREVLHIHKGSREKWKRCNYDVNMTQDLITVIPYHKNLSRRGVYRSLIYSGTADSIVPTLSTEAWIKSLDYPIVDEWRAWFVDGQCAGYTRSYANNMTFASVLGAGHVAPEYKPKECQAMLKRWISDAPL